MVSNLKVRITAEKSSLEKSSNKVIYHMVLSDRCCHTEDKRIDIISNKQMWELGEDREENERAMAMKELTVLVLECHKFRVAKEGNICRLDYTLKDCVLPQTEMMWQYIPGCAKIKIRKGIMMKKEELNQRKKGCQSR